MAFIPFCLLAPLHKGWFLLAALPSQLGGCLALFFPHHFPCPSQGVTPVKVQDPPPSWLGLPVNCQQVGVSPPSLNFNAFSLSPCDSGSFKAFLGEEILIYR